MSRISIVIDEKEVVLFGVPRTLTNKEAGFVAEQAMREIRSTADTLNKWGEFFVDDVRAARAKSER